MSRIIRILKTIKNHPKKSILFSALFLYGAKYGKDRYNEEQLLAAYCREAERYGEERHPVSAAHRHITVLLNPAAANGKCKVMFDKYCAPLLHLSGLKVAVVRTEHQGQARDLMGLMEKTDGVVVAGGDGTLSEVLTGLLRRPDYASAARRLPVSVLPLGSSSTVGRSVWGITDSKPSPQHLLEATMAVVRQVLRTMDVMEVTPLARDGEEALPKPIYANHLEWGSYRDAWERRDTYWYWATLRRYATFVFSSYKDLSWDCSSNVQYTEPCGGCSSCYVSDDNEVPSTVHSPPKKWYQYLLPSMRSSIKQQQQPVKEGLLDQPNVDCSHVVNPSCGVVHETEVRDVCDLRVTTCNTPTTPHLQGHQLMLHMGTPNTTTTQFISEGWRRCWTGTETDHTSLLAGSVTITPQQVTKKKTAEDKDREFSLDGESYEGRKIHKGHSPAWQALDSRVIQSWWDQYNQGGMRTSCVHVLLNKVIPMTLLKGFPVGQELGSVGALSIP